MLAVKVKKGVFDRQTMIYLLLSLEKKALVFFFFFFVVSQQSTRELVLLGVLCNAFVFPLSLSFFSFFPFL